MGGLRRERHENRSCLHQFRGCTTLLKFARVVTYLYQNINEKSARREFCGNKKRISPEAMAKLDQDIAKEEADGNRSLAEQSKWRKVMLILTL